MNKIILFCILGILTCSSCAWFCKKSKCPPTDQSTLILNDSLALLDKIERLDTAHLPEFIIRVNVHYIDSRNGMFYRGKKEDEKPVNGNVWAHRLINHANSILENLEESGTSKNSFVGNSRIRLKIYSDPSNPLDSNGGIWYWTSRRMNKSMYNEDVLNIVIEDYGQPKDFKLNGYACGMNFCNEIVLQDAYDNAANGGRFGWWSFASLLCHELGHVMGLCHSFYCGNECKDVDIDIAKECKINPCFSDCGGPNVGFCDNWKSGSKNMMGYNPNQSSLSPCQWKIAYRNLCFTKARFVVRRKEIKN